MTLNIALTGGIGSGKSTVADRLAELGAVIIDADELARVVVQPGRPALAEIVRRFGNDILTEAGELDRAKLAELVFADDAERVALNAIVHPAIREESTRLKDEALANDARSIIVEDIPLLVESGRACHYQGVMVVHASKQTRLQRLEQRGLPPSQAQARIDAQAREEQRLEVADWVVDNNSTIDALNTQVRQVWTQRLVPYRDALIGQAHPQPQPGRAQDQDITRALARLEAAFEAHTRQVPTIEVEEHIRIWLPHPVHQIGGIMRQAGFVECAAGGFVSGDPHVGLHVVIT
ncbi:MAG TPA: dephospho-CoA kinase [Beutenbergiaceae bacterium]|nr:dephospho-CoA kinase [Beutenbergiaceae bacterium]